MKKFFLLFVLVTLSVLVAACATLDVKEETLPAGVENSVESEPTAAPVAEPTAIPTEEMEEVEDIEEPVVLTGLPISEFFEAAYNELLKRDPEAIAEMGLEEVFPTEQLLSNLSSEYQAETNALREEILSILLTYDYEALSSEDQISYQVMQWDMEDQIAAYEYRMNDYPVTYMSVRSIPQLSIMFFTDTLIVDSYDDAALYIERLEALGTKIDQVSDMLVERESAGVIPPSPVLYGAISDINQYLGRTPVSSPLYTTFRSQIRAVDEISDEQEDELLEETETILKDTVYPAFDRLEATLKDLSAKASSDVSIYQYDNGDEYYQFLLKHFTTTDLTPEEIHESGQVELTRIQDEIRGLFSELGYEEDISIVDGYQMVINESGTVTGDAVTQGYEAILQHADENLGDFFNIRPQASLEVVGGNVGAFYSPGSLDGTRPGRFYAHIYRNEPVYKMPSLAYHEGIPGHHFQIALAQEADLPGFRSVIIFDGYAEGWALYSEYLASELGWYEDDPYGDLGRLQYEALRACRMIIDTGIHVYGWDPDEAVDFLVENTGIDRGFAQNEVWRYIAYPGQATAYMVGKLEILRLRELAMDSFGDEFDIKAFHDLVLQNGSVPLNILDDLVVRWIEENS